MFHGQQSGGEGVSPVQGESS